MIATAVTNTIAALQSAIAALSPMQGASVRQLAPVATAAQAALNAIDADRMTTEASIDQTSVGGVVTGTPAPVLAGILLGQMQAALDLSNLLTTRGYIGRVAANVENAPG